MTAKRTEIVEHSDLYIFASSGEPGFTLSRSFGGPTPGVMGADLAAVDLANFLRQQRITPGSTAFIFTKAGEVVALPDQARLVKAVHADGELKAMLPKIADLNDPVIDGLVAAYQINRWPAPASTTSPAAHISAGSPISRRATAENSCSGSRCRSNEVEKPITDIRNDTLLYSVAFLIFALPLYVTLVVIWINRRLERRTPQPRFRDDE